MASIYKIIYYICLTNIYEIELLLKGVNPIFFFLKKEPCLRFVLEMLLINCVIREAKPQR